MEGRTAGTPAKGHVTGLIVIALIMGGGGLGLGAYSLISGGQETQGLEGSKGDQGLQGSPGMVGPVVGITQPGNNTVISGNIAVRIILWNSTPCTFDLLVNGSLNATELPWTWDTNASKFGNGWWNLTVRATNTTGAVGQDQVLVFIDNCEDFWGIQIADFYSHTLSGTFTDINNLSLTVTIARPKILKLSFSSVVYDNTASAAYINLRFTRDGSTIGDTQAYAESWWIQTSFECSVLCDPGTYSIKVVASTNSAGTWNIGGGGTLYRVFCICAFDP